MHSTGRAFPGTCRGLPPAGKRPGVGMEQLKRKLDKLGLAEIGGPYVDGTIDVTFQCFDRDTPGWLDRLVGRVRGLLETLSWE